MNIGKIVKPATPEEVSRLLAADPAARILAGGVWLHLTGADLPLAVDLSGLGLADIRETRDSWEIGAMTPLSEIEGCPGLQSLCGGILPRAAASVMGPGVRNLATIGGSVMGKFGFSDLIGPLLVLEARLRFQNTPEMTLETFLNRREPLRDLLVEIVVPKTEGQGYFHKVVRTALDFALLNVAIIRIGRMWRIAVGSRPGIAVRCREAEALLTVETPSPSLLSEAAAEAASECGCGGNRRASAEYRRQLARTYLGRGLSEVNTHAN